MISAITRRSKICFTKIIITFSIMFLIILGTGATVAATEITADPATDASSQVTVATGSAVTAFTEGDTLENLTADGFVLGEGYYVDEQGQVYYDESLITLEEPVIMDIPEEDTQEAEEDSQAADTDKADADTNGTKNTKDQTKQDKEPEVKKPSYSEADLRLLSCLIYAEAGNQSYKGMLAVANVVLNRAKSVVFWHVNTIKEVIYDRKWSIQFAVTIKSSKSGLSPLDKALKCYDTGKFSGANPEAEKQAMQRAIKAAKSALEGKNNIGNYLCFTYKGGSSSIKRKYPDYKIIGDHIFYRTK